MPRKVSPKEEKIKSPELDLLDLEGKVVGKVTLAKEIFGAKINPKLIAQAIRVYLVNQRQGTQSTKTRGQVRGTTKKMYAQKGTGRARHGAATAPIFVGGGIAHGPQPRDFELKMSKKMRRRALFSALSDKFEEKALFAIEGLEAIKPKTAEMVKIFKNLKLETPKAKVLLVLPKKIENLMKAARNIEGATLTQAALLNPYQILSHKKIIFLKDALPEIEKTFLPEKGNSEEKKAVKKNTAKQ
ncbi:50S ribosomal protein L4 [Candidatus Microgenomates bacterium]|nr:50S ribosomal protein L4 [Candidatus Microgenomates bacterium]